MILAICVGYTLLGGFRAVIGTDFIQALLILVGLVVIAVLAIRQVGFDSIHSAVLAERPELLNLLMPAAIMFLFNNLLFGIGEIFHSNVWWSRAFSFRAGVGFKAYTLAGLLWAPIPIVAGFVALAVPALQLNVPAADMVGPMVAANLLGVTGAVLVLLMVFAALSSSLDSLLAATSILVVEDIYRRHIKPHASAEDMRRAAARIIVGLGVLTWLLCAPRLTTSGGTALFHRRLRRQHHLANRRRVVLAAHQQHCRSGRHGAGQRRRPVQLFRYRLLRSSTGRRRRVDAAACCSAPGWHRVISTGNSFVKNARCT